MLKAELAEMYERKKRNEETGKSTEDVDKTIREWENAIEEIETKPKEAKVEEVKEEKDIKNKSVS